MRHRRYCVRAMRASVRSHMWGVCSHKRFFCIVIPAKAGTQAVFSTLELQTMNKQPAVYILASKRNGTLYVGVTSALIKRAHEHKNGTTCGFTNQYGVHMLVHYELFEDMVSFLALF